MAVYQTAINGIRGEVTAKTGDYRLVVAMALALADVEPLPVVVTVWCNDLLPDYGPYRYRVQTDRFGALLISPA